MDTGLRTNSSPQTVWGYNDITTVLLSIASTALYP